MSDHATVRCVALIASGDVVEQSLPSNHRACDWSPFDVALEDNAGAGFAGGLLRGEEWAARSVPACATCSLFIDDALLIRAEAEQAKYDAERAAEKRGVA